MKISDFLRIVGQPGRTNYFVVCPDELGLSMLLQKSLAKIATPEDIYFHDAEGLTKVAARMIEAESRRGSIAGAELSHIYIYRLSKLPPDSVGPLLKAVEEAKSARFIFQTQTVERKLLTLMSRSSVVKLPFLSRKVVLANMKAMNHDAKTADAHNLYDGTLAGSIKALQMKDKVAELRREIKLGNRGLVALFNPENLSSMAFNSVVADIMNKSEKNYLLRNSDLVRKKIALFLALRRL